MGLNYILWYSQKVPMLQDKFLSSPNQSDELVKIVMLLLRKYGLNISMNSSLNEVSFFSKLLQTRQVSVALAR